MMSTIAGHKFGETCLGQRTGRAKRDLAVSVRGHKKLNPQAIGRENLANAIGPLDDDDRARCDHFLKSKREQLGRSREPVRIQMKQRQPPGVFVYERKRGAGHPARIVKSVAAGEPLDELRFSRPERTDERDDEAAIGHGTSQRCAKFDGSFGRFRGPS